MKIILNQNVQEIGSVGQVIDVKDGYARNFLFPRGLAALATPANVKQVERQQAKRSQKKKTSAARPKDWPSRSPPSR